MNANEVNILTLVYSINFRDADDGDCYAGDGCKILSVHKNRAAAEAIASEFNPILSQAEKETIVFPVQQFSRVIREKFGFTTNDINDGYDFKLVVETFDVDV